MNWVRHDFLNFFNVVPIIECPAGTYGINCTHTCPEGYYGRLCSGMCNCSRFEICHPTKGCTNEPEYYKVIYGKVYFACFVFVRYNSYEALLIKNISILF